ncbi:DUF441 domain-containing protein [Fuchsiella alkaliacetigena]|nr:DUF441 domain-containing protein [Fuchsiella alkaliacetigena]
MAKSDLIALAAVILFVIKVLELNLLFPFLENQALDLGLLFLTLAVLTPLVSNSTSSSELLAIFKSPVGIAALIGGLLATKLNGVGLNLLESDPRLIIGMVFGSLVGIIFLDGIPVGPLMASGLTALLAQVFQIILS